jgi:hypothetical protein
MIRWLIPIFAIVALIFTVARLTSSDLFAEIAQQVWPADATVNVVVVDAPECGDVNNDAILNIDDADTVLRIAVRQSNPNRTQKIIGDLNRDSRLNVIDSIILLKKATADEPQPFLECGPPQ